MAGLNQVFYITINKNPTTLNKLANKQGLIWPKLLCEHGVLANTRLITFPRQTHPGRLEMRDLIRNSRHPVSEKTTGPAPQLETPHGSIFLMLRLGPVLFPLRLNVVLSRQDGYDPKQEVPSGRNKDDVICAKSLEVTSFCFKKNYFCFMQG